MAQREDIRFSDFVEREKRAISDLRATKAQLQKRRNSLTQSDKKELDRVEKVLKYYDENKPAPPDSPTELADPLFVAARDAFNESRGILKQNKAVLNHSDGKIRTSRETEFEDVVKISLVLGLLASDRIEAPRLILSDKNNRARSRIGVDRDDKKWVSFTEKFWAAAGIVQGVLPLATKTLSWLESKGDNDPDEQKSPGVVDSVEFANVIRCLRNKALDETTPQLERQIEACLDSIQHMGGENRPLTDTPLELPDLMGNSDYQIQADNVRNIGAIIMTAMLEELKVFQVVDRLIELSQNGLLPIGGSDAGELLFKWWKESPNRMSEAERRNFYAVTIGLVGGETNGGTNNREFNDLWMRFVSSVATLVRQKSVDKLLQQSIPAAIGQQQVRKAARDLALNLSAHGYGMAFYTARELQAEIKKIIDLLGHKDIMGAFGARDMWQVIDQVAATELGGAKNSARSRTLATCGAIITTWLAKNVNKLNRPTTEPIINLAAVTSVDPPSAGPEATKNPEDYDLVNACELWLADTGTSEDRIEQMAREPRESPAMTSKPIQIPSVAREMLEQAGIPGGFGMGMRH